MLFNNILQTLAQKHYSSLMERFILAGRSSNATCFREHSKVTFRNVWNLTKCNIHITKENIKTRCFEQSEIKFSYCNIHGMLWTKGLLHIMITIYHMYPHELCDLNSELHGVEGHNCEMKVISLWCVLRTDLLEEQQQIHTDRLIENGHVVSEADLLSVSIISVRGRRRDDSIRRRLMTHNTFTLSYINNQSIINQSTHADSPETCCPHTEQETL